MMEPSEAATPSEPPRRRPRRRRCSTRRPACRRASAAWSRSTRVDFDDPAAVDRVDHRAERRGQDDLLQHAHRPLQADHRPDHRSTAATSPRMRPGPDHRRWASRARSRTSACSATMSAVENVMVGAALAHEGGPVPARSCARRAQRSEEKRRRARRRARSSRYVGLQRARVRRDLDQPRPTATSAGSRSRARSRPTRSCCCSTSRRPA